MRTYLNSIVMQILTVAIHRNYNEIYSKGNTAVISNESVMQALLNHSICRKLDQNNAKNKQFQIYSKELGGVKGELT